MSAWGMCAAVLAIGAIAAAGCRDGETITKEEFLDSIREQGVEIELGRELLTTEAGKELYAIELEPLSPELPGDAEVHTGGSLAVHDDSDGADRSLERCEASADLLCYRAANVVVVLEGGGIEAERLGVAMEKLAEE
jgi:hypothetical protein